MLGTAQTRTATPVIDGGIVTSLGTATGLGVANNSTVTITHGGLLTANSGFGAISTGSTVTVDLRSTRGGMSAGIDYLITDHRAVGLFGGYSHTWVDFKPGSADVDTGRGGLYATYFDPTGWWVNAGVWGGYNSYSTSRRAVFGPANGSTDGYEIAVTGTVSFSF